MRKTMMNHKKKLIPKLHIPLAKLCTARGETLPEALASILICTLSVGFLVSGIMASKQINSQAQQADEGFYETLSRAEKKDGSDTATKNGTVKIKSDEAGFMTQTIDVTFYGGPGLYSYKAKAAPGGGGTGG